MQDIWLDGKKFPGQNENYHGLCPIPQSRRLGRKVKKTVPCICVQIESQAGQGKYLSWLQLH